MDPTAHLQENSEYYGLYTILFVIGLWMVFRKAEQPGWAAIIPFYNVIVYLRVIGKPWWWLLMLFIPVVNLVFIIWGSNLLSKSFGKSTLFTVGLVILPAIFYLILGTSNDAYQGPAGSGQNDVLV